MTTNLDRQQQQYDRSWHSGLAEGKENFGNLAVNLAFLAESGVLQPGLKVLEVGCGIGTLAHGIAQQGCDVVATDLSRKAIEYGRAKYRELALQVSAAEELAFADEAFDLVVSFDLFEHLEDVDLHLREVKRVLRGGGRYAFATPNRFCAATFDTLRLRNRSWRQFHPSLHSYRQLRRRLRAHGLEPRFFKMNTINEFTMAKLRRYGRLARWVRRLDTRRLPWNLQSNFYVVAGKGLDEKA